MGGEHIHNTTINDYGLIHKSTGNKKTVMPISDMIGFLEGMNVV
jgi:hypothetical protein